MTELAITGAGAVSVFGVGREALERGLAGGALPERRPLSSFPASATEEAYAREVPDFAPAEVLGDKGLRILDRLTKELLVAARLCLRDAGMKSDAGEHLGPGGLALGVCCSNAYGSLEAITELDRVAMLEDRRYINPQKFPNTVSNSAAGYVSIWEDLRAFNVSVSNGTCGGLDVFGVADLHLAAQRAHGAIVGGGEAMSEALLLAFLKLCSEEHAIVGEGAAFVAVERLESAEARGARVEALVCGYGASFIAPERESQLVSASPEPLVRATRAALADAALAPEDVDLVVGGQSGIGAFDAAEDAALAFALPHGPPVSAPKRVLGETFGAGAALAVLSALPALRGEPPTALRRGSTLDRPVRHVLVTTLGHYGNASALVLRRPS